jgi:hypothetical protein
VALRVVQASAWNWALKDVVRVTRSIRRITRATLVTHARGLGVVVAKGAGVVSHQQWAGLAVREPDEVRRAVRASRRSWLIFGSLATGLCGMVAATKLAVFDQPGGFNPDSDAQLMVVTLVVLLVGLFVGLSWYARWQRRLGAKAMVEHHGFYTSMFMPADQGMNRFSTLVLAPDGVWLIPGTKLARHESTTHIAVGQIVGIRAWSEGRGSRGHQLEILGATGVLVRGWVLTMGRGQLGIEKFLDKLGQPPSNFSTSNGTPQRGVVNTPAVAAIAGKPASGLVYPATAIPTPRNYQWIIWKVMVGGFLPLFAVIAGAAQTAQFESVHRDPNASR